MWLGKDFYIFFEIALNNPPFLPLTNVRGVEKVIHSALTW
jgi:hypothetical protein